MPSIYFEDFFFLQFSWDVYTAFYISHAPTTVSFIVLSATSLVSPAQDIYYIYSLIEKKINIFLPY